MRRNLLIFIFTSIFASGVSLAQNGGAQAPDIIGQDEGNRVISTAVPFLSIAPDARVAGLGDAGSALSADVNAIHWNTAKLAFIENQSGVSFSITPWLANIVNDMYLYYLNGFYKVSDDQTIALAMRYFDLGDMEFRDDNGQFLQDFNPREFSFEGAYAQKLSEYGSVGVGLQFVYSNLTGNAFTGGGTQSQPGVSIGGDIGWYYKRKVNLLANPGVFSYSIAVNDFGSKMTYSSDTQQEFIPTTFRLGTTLTTELDPFNTLTLAIETSKLMVPSPPIYERDDNGTVIIDQDTGKPKIRKGKDPDRGVLSGMFGSFFDAPGGVSEEFREVMIGAGLEYWYNQTFAGRAGYFYEDKTKGGRSYFTLGLGFRYNVFGLDVAYLVPTTQNHPLAQTLRFTLLFNFNQNTATATK